MESIVKSNSIEIESTVKGTKRAFHRTESSSSSSHVRLNIFNCFRPISERSEHQTAASVPNFSANRFKIIRLSIHPPSPDAVPLFLSNRRIIGVNPASSTTSDQFLIDFSPYRLPCTFSTHPSSLFQPLPRLRAVKLHHYCL